MSLNKVMLIGNAGQDPEVRYLDNGVATATLRLATSTPGYTLPSGAQVPERTAYEVYRIFQEQMANIIKRSGAGRIEAELSLSDSVLSLTVRYDGKAFSPAGSSQSGRGDGIGLSVMAERAKAIGAAISDTEDGGIRVFRLDVPISDLE